MKKTENKAKPLTASQSAMIASAIEQLKGVALFPEKYESAKKLLKNVKFKTN